MPKWNCRLVEVNGAEDPSAWYSITAANSKVAAEEMCNHRDMWDSINWENGFSAIVEVEEFYGESGTRRIEVVAADVLRFFASE